MRVKMKIVLSIVMWFVMLSVTVGLVIMIGVDLEDNGMTLFAKSLYVSFLLGLLWFYMFHFKNDLLWHVKQMLLLMSVYLVVAIPVLLLIQTDYIWVIPFTMFGMMITLTLDEGLGMICNLVMTLIFAVAGNLPFTFVLTFIISGILVTILVMKVKERQKMLYIAGYMMGINGILVLINRMLLSGDGFILTMNVFVFAMIHAALAVIMTYGSLPIFEGLFGIVTPYKLLELSNSNQELLQRIMMLAPGTYHHCQMVANLSEAAASDVGADALLARSGALYHDLGKIRGPEYFIENQNGVNIHDTMDPEESAKKIIAHVREGVKIATDHKLPKPIINIIREHHGDLIMYYFYQKAKDHSDGFDIDPKPFRYAGPKPQSNEAAIVMLADSTEAAVRSMKDQNKDLEKVQALVHKIIQGKLLDHQLDTCDLKVKDLVLIEKAFMRVYNGLYHERIQYQDDQE